GLPGTCGTGAAGFSCGEDQGTQSPSALSAGRKLLGPDRSERTRLAAGILPLAAGNPPGNARKSERQKLTRKYMAHPGVSIRVTEYLPDRGAMLSCFHFPHPL